MRTSAASKTQSTIRALAVFCWVADLQHGGVNSSRNRSSGVDLRLNVADTRDIRVLIDWKHTERGER